MAEHWTTQEGNSLLGVNRLVRDDVTVHREFLRIEIALSQTVLTVERPGKEPVSYVLVRNEAGSATFENPAHRRLHTQLYRRDGNQLICTLMGERDGVEWTEDITFVAK